MSAGLPFWKSHLARRGVLVGGLALGGGAAAYWFNIAGSVGGGALSVQAAHQAARDGEITLVDIRRPDEWAHTGVPEGSIPLDMRDPEFALKMLRLLPDKSAPVALICARGVRSRGLSNRLRAVGFTNVIDVPEGMLGSGAGPGWLAARLPVTEF